MPQATYETPPSNLLTSIGHTLRVIGASLHWQEVRQFQGRTFGYLLRVLGVDAVPLVTLGSIAVSVALTTHVVLEAQRFDAEDMAGAAIAIGLLRELGSLTVGLSWACRTTAILSQLALDTIRSGASLGGAFFLPSLLSSWIVALPLSLYGMVLGIGASAFYSVALGVSSPNDFLEAARHTVSDEDIFVYFLKMVVLNPVMVVLGSTAAALGGLHPKPLFIGRAIVVTCVLIFLENLLVTLYLYLK